MSDAHDTDVIAFGNAIVDVLGHTDDAFLAARGIPKGGMRLIGDEEAASLTDALPRDAQVAGGSAGNSLVCLAGLGGTARFCGKTGDDALGRAYRESMTGAGVAMDTPPHDSVPTGRCLIAVTPDAERSMSTALGAAALVGVDDVVPAEVTAARVAYLEGYLIESEVARAAFDKAADAAHGAGRKIAFTTCDTGVVDRQFEVITAFLPQVDLLFANEDEARELAREADLDAAIAKLRGMVPYGAVTRSAAGSVVFGPDRAPVAVPAVTPERLVDTTGAGDAYAGGFLYGFTRDRDLADCAALGSLAAAEVIARMGPRPQNDLKAMAREAGLI